MSAILKMMDAEKESKQWICCQVGAREHFAIPRALFTHGRLAHLISDAWVPPKSLWAKLPKTALQERFHPELDQANISAFNLSLIKFELLQTLSKVSGWNKVIARNYWFQEKALNQLRNLTSNKNQSYVLFSYSYAALDLFRYARQQGWFTVLGQIDPGPAEEEIVRREYERYPDYRGTWEPAPSHYWQSWRDECALADRIIVNSTWSEQALIQSEIYPQKIAVIPLAYELPANADHFKRQYPTSFNSQRPMRVLFLGQIILRKGIGPLIEAISSLKAMSIEIWLVGPNELTLSHNLLQNPQLKILGSVPRSQVLEYYRQADVFLFPTHSDGFGLTQLEAQAWKLPIIVSPYCADVVKSGHNGIVLPDVKVKYIVNALIYCYQNPAKLQKWSEQAIDMRRYNLQNLSMRLNNLVNNHHY